MTSGHGSYPEPDMDPHCLWYYGIMYTNVMKPNVTMTCCYLWQKESRHNINWNS